MILRFTLLSRCKLCNKLNCSSGSRLLPSILQQMAKINPQYFVSKRGGFSTGHNLRVALFFRSQGKKLLVLCLGINLGKPHGYLLYRHFLAIPKTSQKTGVVLQQAFSSKSLASGFPTCSTRFALKNKFIIKQSKKEDSIKA